MIRKNQQFSPINGRSGGQPKHFSGVLGRVMRSLGLSNSYNGWLVVTRWPQIVGTAIAEKAGAVRYEDGSLYVAVQDASWRQELAMRQDELLEKIHSFPYGKAVKEIRLVQGRKGFENYGD